MLLLRAWNWVKNSEKTFTLTHLGIYFPCKQHLQQMWWVGTLQHQWTNGDNVIFGRQLTSQAPSLFISLRLQTMKQTRGLPPKLELLAASTLKPESWNTPSKMENMKPTYFKKNKRGKRCENRMVWPGNSFQFYMFYGHFCQIPIQISGYGNSPRGATHVLGPIPHAAAPVPGHAFLAKSGAPAI